MKFNNAVNIATVACLSVSPTLALVTSCFDAVDSISKIPGHFIQNVQLNACPAGCSPNIDQWNSDVKEEILNELMEDGIGYTGINDEAAQKAFVKAIDDLYTTVVSKCQKESDGLNLCDDEDKVQPFLDCVNSNARTAVLKGVPGLLPYITNDRCQKVDEYLNSDQLWKDDFPEHFKSYVDKCHDI
ncbi:hypothetical protein AAWM_04093 [Aspergillus awamori]|uniref:Uncharacterized protein n=2 Tax=Aspergillus TaxID=5052 RepID=A0A3F3Q9R5_9EURO|nr:hypothetical protein BDQ94DRAFT_168259 [Aspergillus welwitschiae]GCB21208.1 hypothetical protein AAWM_04093 [Aspergillus awamori]GKZ58007.1 hypothetical protein AnigIFM49718_003812 [Aspergillus niger]RDH35940.1 hypothetical protein BDQ94DRAFT_168259 [Aspergillus welwitschiae]GKZ74114.1 hypothetical protein AnigIFM50267_011355 [Aspergillus niger]GKZ94007.1 hypothetical protein AnigIFM59636_007369 [Aspergillus niger]